MVSVKMFNVDCYCFEVVHVHGIINAEKHGTQIQKTQKWRMKSKRLPWKASRKHCISVYLWEYIEQISKPYIKEIYRTSTSEYIVQLRSNRWFGQTTQYANAMNQLWVLDKMYKSYT